MIINKKRFPQIIINKKRCEGFKKIPTQKEILTKRRDSHRRSQKIHTIKNRCVQAKNKIKNKR